MPVVFYRGELVVMYWGERFTHAEISSAKTLGHDCSQVTKKDMHVFKLKLCVAFYSTA